MTGRIEATAMAMVIAGVITGPTSAAVITWSAADDTNAVADVYNLGMQHVTANAGEATARTVNSVTFASTSTAPLGTAASGMLIGTVAGFTSADPIWNMLNTVSFGGGNGTTTISLTGLTAGESYAVQVFYADRRVGSETRVMRFGDGNGNNVDLLGGTNTGNVMGRNAVGVFTAGATTQSLTLAPQGFGNSHINAYQVRKLSANSVLSNAGFESGPVDSTAFGWHTEADTITPTNGSAASFIRSGAASEGTRYMQFRGGGSVDGSDANGAISQLLASASGQTYRLSFDYRAGIGVGTPDLSTISLRVTVTSFGGSLGDLLDQTVSGFTLAWQQFVTTYVGDGSAVTLMLRESSTNSFNRDPWVDNFSIIAVPAPAALPAGLAIMTLGAMRRRRNR